ncbi:MAG: tRNA (N6-threonylcarbamoyladenosine(37)-N6)-methyltransferase TrmO [Bdellovibrionia bacterium]
MEVKPIGYFHSPQKHSYEAGRQPDANSLGGYIQLLPGHNFEQALEELEKFSHIWVLFQFHHNEQWKPKVMPPRGSAHKVGVFATRAPYRPNPVGMSAVKLVSIQGLKIFISAADLLDGTPVIDIKPYVPEVDIITDATMGWIQDQKYSLTFSAEVETQIEFLEHLGVSNLKNFIIHQLEFQPFAAHKKRLRNLGPNLWELAYRTWRVHFMAENETLLIQSLSSGYTPEELKSTEDPYNDKAQHLAFLKHFNLN